MRKQLPNRSALRGVTFRRWVAPLLVVSGAIGAAAAEETPPDPDLSVEETRQAGPFHIRPYILLQYLGYDDNIFFEDEDPVGDVTARVAPGLSALLLTGKRGGLLVEQEFAYTAFSSFDDLNYWDSRTRLKGVFLTKELAFSLEDRYTTSRNRPNLEIDKRVRENRHALTAAVRTHRTGRLGLEAVLGRERIDYSSDDFESEVLRRRLNRDERLLAVLGNIEILPKTELILEARVGKAVFDQESARRDTQSISFLTGLSFDPSAFLQGSFTVGYMSLVVPDRPDSDYQGMIGEGSLSMRIGRFGRLTGALGRGVEFSSLASNVYYVATYGSAAYEQFFSRRLSGQLSYRRGLHHYPQEVVLPGPTLGIRDDHFTKYGLELRYRMRKELSFGAAITHFDRDSTDDSVDVKNNRYFIGSEYTF